MFVTPRVNGVMQIFQNARFADIVKGAMSHTAHVRDEALHLENVRQFFQVLRVIQYQEFIVIYQ